LSSIYQVISLQSESILTCYNLSDCYCTLHLHRSLPISGMFFSIGASLIIAGSGMRGGIARLPSP
jgi:hypothetical protein